jgi:hypothetical protein
MASPAPNGQEYSVFYREQVRQQIKNLAERARQKGMAKKFLAALKTINATLARTPPPLAIHCTTFPLQSSRSMGGYSNPCT